MREYSLIVPPLGPFNEGQKEMLPVNDALLLSSGNDALLTGNSALKWVCMKKAGCTSQFWLPYLFSIFKKNRVETHKNAIKAQEIGMVSTENCNKNHVYDDFMHFLGLSSEFLFGGNKSTGALFSVVFSQPYSRKGVFNEPLNLSRALPYFPAETMEGLNSLYFSFIDSIESKGRIHGFRLIKSRGLNFAVRGKINSFLSDGAGSVPLLVVSAKKLFF